GPLLGLGEEGAHQVLDATARAQACRTGRRVARLQQIRGSCSPAPMSTIRAPPIRLFSVTTEDEASATSPIIEAPPPKGCELIIDNARSASGEATKATTLPHVRVAGDDFHARFSRRPPH